MTTLADVPERLDRKVGRYNISPIYSHRLGSRLVFTVASRWSVVGLDTEDTV